MYERTSEQRRLEAANQPGQRPGGPAGRSFLERASTQRPEYGDIAEPPGEPSVRQLASILLRRRWMIAAVTLTGTLLLTAAAMMIPPAYTAMTQIEVVPTESAGANATASPAATQMVVDTHMVMLGTHDFLKKVVAPLPHFQNGSNDRMIDDLAKQISIEQLMSSSIIAIRVTLPDPEEAASLANRMADVYLDQQVAGQVAQLRDELTRVETRISRVRDAMSSAQARMR
ncbi:MAG: Wzz/FepE/Etk N-terminal domain-containing protein, partial [Dichotomicrobium sp.]